MKERGKGDRKEVNGGGGGVQGEWSSEKEMQKEREGDERA